MENAIVEEIMKIYKSEGKGMAAIAIGKLTKSLDVASAEIAKAESAETLEKILSLYWHKSPRVNALSAGEMTMLTSSRFDDIANALIINEDLFVRVEIDNITYYALREQVQKQMDKSHA